MVQFYPGADFFNVKWLNTGLLFDCLVSKSCNFFLVDVSFDSSCNLYIYDLCCCIVFSFFYFIFCAQKVYFASLATENVTEPYYS